MRARDVIARIEAVEVAPHLTELLGAIRGKWLGGFVASTCDTLALDETFDLGACGQRASARPHRGDKIRVVVAENRVNQPKLARRFCAQGQSLLHDRLRRTVLDASRQQVSPVFGAIKVPHVLVMRIEDHAASRPHVVGGERHENAARAAVSLQGGNGDAITRLEDRAHDVVDGIDVAPRFVGGALGCFDDVEMDAVGPEIRPTHENENASRPRERERVGGEQALALGRAHRAVVEGEVEVTDGIHFLIADFAVAGAICRHVERHLRCGQRMDLCGEGQRDRQLVCERAIQALRVADPDAAIGGRAQDGAIATRDDRARRGRLAEPLGVRVIEVAGDAEQVVAHAGRTVRRTDLAQNHLHFVASPVDSALLLRH